METALTLDELRATKRDAVRALSISSHGETIVPLDRRGSAIRPALMNADNRAVAESRMLERKLGEQQLYRRTGLPPGSGISFRHRNIRESRCGCHRYAAPGLFTVARIRRRAGGHPPAADRARYDPGL